MGERALSRTGTAIDFARNDQRAEGALGPYLQIEDWIRFALDHMTSNADWQALVSILASPEGNRTMRAALLETPIMGMDRAFFGMARSMFLQHPRLYGSAFRAAWQRIAARA